MLHATLFVQDIVMLHATLKYHCPVLVLINTSLLVSIYKWGYMRSTLALNQVLHNMPASCIYFVIIASHAPLYWLP